LRDIPLKQLKKHMTQVKNNDYWKYFPVQGKISQFVYQKNDGRMKYSENPDNPLVEFELYCQNSQKFKLLMIPPCAAVTYFKAKELFERVLVIDYNKNRLETFIREVDPQAESIWVEDQQALRSYCVNLFNEMSNGLLLSYIPERYKRLDQLMTDLLCHELLQIQKEYSSIAVHRSLRAWHKNLNALLNLSVVDKRLDVFPDIAKSSAVIVGAGPSLDDTVAKLKSQKKKALVIATDGSVQSLVKNGVIPDFIVSCDDSLLTWRFMASIKTQLVNVPLFVDFRANHYLVKNYPGPVILTHSSCADFWSEPFVKDFPLLEMGKCVGHMAFNLAIAVNAGQVVMTGFDLACKGGRFHPEDMPVPYYHERNMPVPVTVESIHGEFLKTDLSMLIYLKDFEFMIEAATVPIIDCTEGGARKKGTEVKPLERTLKDCLALKEFCLDFSPIGRDQKRAFNNFISTFRTGRLDSQGRDLVNGFSSYLVQNSRTMSSKEKEEDRRISYEFIQLILVEKSSVGKKAVLVESEDVTEEIKEWALNNSIDLVPECSFPELLEMVQTLGVGKILTVNGRLIPDLLLLTDVEYIDIKTNDTFGHYERCNWLPRYSVWALPKVYEFWRSVLPVEVGLCKFEHRNSEELCYG
jgi:hypothetical protein